MCTYCRGHRLGRSRPAENRRADLPPSTRATCNFPHPVALRSRAIGLFLLVLPLMFSAGTGLRTSSIAARGRRWRWASRRRSSHPRITCVVFLIGVLSCGLSSRCGTPRDPTPGDVSNRAPRLRASSLVRGRQSAGAWITLHRTRRLLKYLSPYLRNATRAALLLPSSCGKSCEDPHDACSSSHHATRCVSAPGGWPHTRCSCW